MSATPQNARKEMIARFDSVWNAKAPAIVAPADVPVIRYQGHEIGALPGAKKYWVRFGTTNVTTEEGGYVQDDGPEQSPVAYDTYGFITAQLFAPMIPGGYEKGELLAELAQCMFMRYETPSGVWFRKPRIEPLENDGTWYRWNIFVDYRFSQIKGN